MEPARTPQVQHAVKRILLRAPKGPFEVCSAEETLGQNLIADNSGNLVFIHAAWKLLSAPGVEITPDCLGVRPDDADEINERFDAYVVPLANAFRLQFRDPLVRMTELVRRLRIPVVVLGVGAQGTPDYGWDAIRPIDGPVKDFVSAVLDRSPTIGVRGEATCEYLNGLGFHDVEVIGCPSMFMWGDTLDVKRKVATLDEQSNVAITISPYRAAMGRIAMAAYTRYPRLTYFAQDLPTLSLLIDGTPLPGGTPNRSCRSIPATRSSASTERGSTWTPGPGSRTSAASTSCSEPGSTEPSPPCLRGPLRRSLRMTRGPSSWRATSTSRTACCATSHRTWTRPTSTPRRTSRRSMTGTRVGSQR